MDKLKTHMDKKVILIIDDSETSVLLVKSMFELSGDFQVESLNTAVNAEKKILSLKPDLILLDIMMPELDGISFLKTIKNRAEIKEIPVIIVSAVENSNEVQAAMEYGAQDYVLKPIGLNKLFSRVSNYLKKTI